MKKSRITTDLFLLPDKKAGDRFIYAPCLGVVLQASDQTLDLISNIGNLNYELLSDEDKATFDYLSQKGIVNGTDTSEIKTEIRPAGKLTLFPTNKCNLACRYCYGRKYQRSSETMDIRTAINAINAHGKVLKENHMNEFVMEFHGGGEPFFEFDLLKAIVDHLENYCESHNFRPEITASTNGVLTDEKRDWIKKHFASLLISFEGLPEIQDYHRPFPDNSPTFPFVDESIRYFDHHRFNYAIRTTVTNKNAGLLKETIGFISENYNADLLFLEPVNDCGGIASDRDLSCNLTEFAMKYSEAERYARLKNIRTVYSGANLQRLSSHFCYVGTNQFAVTPDGFLTNCWEVTSNDHPQAGTFIVGRMLENGTFELYEGKTEFLKTFSAGRRAYCHDCFAKWHCSGGCVMRSEDGVGKDTGGTRCETTRHLMAQKLLSSLKSE